MKKHRHIIMAALFLCLAGLVGWMIHTPRSPAAPPSVSVAVAPPPELPPAAAPPLTATAASGDEKTQPEAVQMPPPLPAPVRQAGAQPEIAIVIDDMGLDLKDSRRAAELPDAVTLSYMPYATRLREQTEEARDAGHELLLHMPMEPMGHDDPGPGALLTSLPPEELRQRFVTALASFTGFDGVNNHMGSKFTANPAGMELVMGELRPRHLFFLDSRTSAQSLGYATAQRLGVPALARDVFLDDDMALAAVRRQLAQTESIARRKGYAIAIGHPHPATLQALEEWLLEAQARGIAFVPLRDLLPPGAP